jgi:tryptophanase
MKKMHELSVPVPVSKSHIIRTLKSSTLNQREKALKETEYNVFSFPADLLLVDYLSDSGTTTMTDMQWSALIHGDEAYGRNKGYYVLLDAIRDTFERGDNKKYILKHILTNEEDVEVLMNEVYLNQFQGGFVNGGKYQLERPNAFIVPQGRCAEYLLFNTLSQVLNISFGSTPKNYHIPNNGHFDTTEANIRVANIHPINLFSQNLFSDFDWHLSDEKNPFKGNMDIPALDQLIQTTGKENIPLIYLTVTNNTAGGQPVSLANIKEVKKIADKYSIPFFIDACRFAENAYFIKHYEPEYTTWSISKIVQEMFNQVDGFHISFKKDGLANIGGGLFFRDQGHFWKKYSIDGVDIGVRIKEKQILTFGNDSYGGLSGRDIMALAMGLYEVVKEKYLYDRIHQVQYMANRLAEKGVPVLLPAGGHAVYLNMDKFFSDVPDMKLDDFGGVGLTIELIRHYGIRAVELGPFAFELDKKSKIDQEGVLNLVRFAVPRNAYSQHHIDYTVDAIVELYNNRHLIPKVKITRGKELNLRHFQTGLEPIYPNTE